MELKNRLWCRDRVDVVMYIFDEIVEEGVVGTPGGLQQLLLHRLLVEQVQTFSKLTDVRMLLLRVGGADEEMLVQLVDVEDALHVVLDALAQLVLQLTLLHGVDLVLRGEQDAAEETLQQPQRTDVFGAPAALPRQLRQRRRNRRQSAPRRQQNRQRFFRF